MSQLTLEKILQSQGFGTRRECRELIDDGEITINGEVVDNPNAKFETDGLNFTVCDEPFEFRAKVYIAVHKPAGFECSRKPSHHPTVLSLLPDMMTARDVQPVGRLDHDTTGLLLMSDDGQFIHQMSSPKWHVPKLYVATCAEPVTQQLVDRLLGGVKLHDEPGPLAVMHCAALDEHRIEIVIDQGKYHQVKRMLAAAGNHCAALARTAIGGLSLAGLTLEPEEWCFLEPHHLEQLRNGDLPLAASKAS